MSLQPLKHFVPALVLALTLSSLNAGNALAGQAGAQATVPPASRAAHDATHPLVMQQTGQEVATARVGPLQPFRPAPRPRSAAAATGNGGNLQREVFGFGLLSSIADPTIGYPSWNFSLLSTVAVFGLHVQDDGTFAADSGWSVWNSSQMTGLLTTAHQAGTKVVLTIILQDFASGTPHMCAGLANRAATVTQTRAEVIAKGVDGVNVDYEGLNGSCPNGQTPRAMMTDLARQLRASLGAASYLSVDTYASSAGDPAGFFDIPGLNANVDSFFVMAYDSDYSNYGHAPIASCTRYCLNPVSPLAGYYYNDTRAATEYSAAVPALKVILGLPYYTRGACVTSQTPNASPVAGSGTWAITYRAAVAMATDPTNTNYAANRDANDENVTPWSTWTSTNTSCQPMEMYWDDTFSLGQKYDLVNQDRLRGVGLWNLNQGGGAGELWSLLSIKFSTAPPWTSIGGNIQSAPGLSTWGTDRTDVFVQGADSSLWHLSRSAGQWSGWEKLGGALGSGPAAVSWAANRIDVFLRGTDGALWHVAWDGTRWTPWQSLGGALASAPKVVSWGSGRLDVFAQGTDGKLWHIGFNGTVWGAWQSLGGALTSAPEAATWGSGRVDVFIRGSDSALWHLSGDGTTWSPWESLGGLLASRPSAVSQAANSLDVFVTAADSTLWQRSWTGSWGPWRQAGGPFTLASGPAAASCSAGHLDVFALGADGAIYHIGYGGAWAPAWQRLGGQWASDPAAGCPAAATSVDVLARGGDSALWRNALPTS